MKIRALRQLSQIITLQGAYAKDGRKLKLEDLSLIENGAVAYSEDKILWVGLDKDFPQKYQSAEMFSLPNKVLMPELVDSHTHLIFAGDRSREYALRLAGATYEDLAKIGGGILSTMRETQKASRNELFKMAVARIEKIYSYGIGSIEIKTGYGLSYEKELELSLVIHDLKQQFQHKIQIHHTFMAAHAIPPGFATSSLYLEKVVLPLLRHLGPQKILDSIDIFYEENYFTREDVNSLFTEAKKQDLSVRMHADEFNNLGGAQLAVEWQALSADHLLQTDEKGIHQLANSKTVATLLPGTGLFLGKKQAEARKFFDAGVKVAFASDYNPGSCHCDNLLLIASLAAPLYKINLAEFWTAITLNAAHSLGFYKQGVLAEGMKPRFSLFDVPNHEIIPYSWGKNYSVPIPH